MLRVVDKGQKVPVFLTIFIIKFGSRSGYHISTMMLTVLVNSCQFYFLHLFSLEDKKQSTPTFAFIFPPVLYFFFIFRYTTIDNAFGGNNTVTMIAQIHVCKLES